MCGGQGVRGKPGCWSISIPWMCGSQVAANDFLYGQCAPAYFSLYNWLSVTYQYRGIAQNSVGAPV